MIYPWDDLREMAQSPGLQDVWAQVPDVLALEDWPDCTFWQQKLDEQAGFRDLLLSLRLFPEVKIGQRRKRKLTKQNREEGRPTLRRYESSIIEDQKIPMRERNVHDYFNALIWVRFPQAKFALHERAYRSYREGPLALTGNLRNDLTDALTRFDEGGVVCFVPTDDVESVRTLFTGSDVEAKNKFIRRHRHQFAIFGHGILEVWLQGDRNITACLLVVASCEKESAEQSLARCLESMTEPYGRFASLRLHQLIGEDQSDREIAANGL